MIIIQGKQFGLTYVLFKFALEGLQLFTGPLFLFASFLATSCIFDSRQSLEAFHIEQRGFCLGQQDG